MERTNPVSVAELEPLETIFSPVIPVNGTGFTRIKDECAPDGGVQLTVTLPAPTCKLVIWGAPS